MLSINIHNEEEAVRFVLRGVLSGNGVDELRCYYRVLSALPTNKSVLLDVSGLTSVDTSGVSLLSEMVQRGAEVLTGTRLATHPLSEILAGLRTAPMQVQRVPHEEMLPLKAILFATDLSPLSQAVLPYVCSLARQHRARVIIAHVIPPTTYSDLPFDIRDKARDSAERIIAARLEELTQSGILQGIEHEVFVDHGYVWPVLAEFMQKRNVDLVAIGTHGRRGMSKLLWGSVAEEVFRLCDRPVLTVGPRALSTARRETGFRKVLVATDFSSQSVRALRYAVQLCGDQQGQLTLIHALHTISSEPLTARMAEAKLFRDCLEDLNLNAGTQVDPEYVVEFGAPATTILRTAEERHSDLIVLGLKDSRAQIGSLGTHLGSTAYAVVSGALCPVMTIRGELTAERSRTEDNLAVKEEVQHAG